MPGESGGFDLDLQTGGRKTFWIDVVCEEQVIGFDFDVLVIDMLVEIRGRLVAIPEYLAGTIFKLTAGAVFHADQAICQQTEPHIRTGNNCLRIGQGIKLDLELGEIH